MSLLHRRGTSATDNTCANRSTASEWESTRLRVGRNKKRSVQMEEEKQVRRIDGQRQRKEFVRKSDGGSGGGHHECLEFLASSPDRRSHATCFHSRQ